MKREPVAINDLFIQLQPSLNIPFVFFCERLTEISNILEVPPEKIRLNDRFAKEYVRFDHDAISTGVMSRAIEHYAIGKLSKELSQSEMKSLNIKTIDDLISCLWKYHEIEN